MVVSKFGISFSKGPLFSGAFATTKSWVCQKKHLSLIHNLSQGKGKGKGKGKGADIWGADSWWLCPRDDVWPLP